MRALLITAVAAVVAAGCSSASSAPPQPGSAPPTSRSLTKVQACQRLTADLARNQGVADIATLRDIADHVIGPRMAADARTAVRDMDHTGHADIALGLLGDDCARAGVHIPGL